jgi:hypothetical protein
MLADPTFVVRTEEQKQSFIEMSTVNGETTKEEAIQWWEDRYNPERVEGQPVGVFYSWQLEHIITGIKDAYEHIPGIGRHGDEWLANYGVCDNFQQVLDRYLIAEIPDRKFCVALCPIFKGDEPPTGGWRWHKWGPYIGTQKSECEYLYDEKDIDVVLIYHIFEIE